MSLTGAAAAGVACVADRAEGHTGEYWTERDAAGGVDLRLWGKSRGLERRYPLILHLLDAAAAAECLWRDYLAAAQRRVVTEGLGLQDEAHAGRLVGLWAGLHDLGKLIPEFQAMDAKAWAVLAAAGYPWVAAGRPLRHDRAAHLALASLLAARGYPTVGTPVGCAAHRVAQLLGGHHGTFHQACTRDQRRWGARVTPALGSGMWEEQRAAHLDLVCSALQHPKPPPVVTPAAAVLATGVIVVADWLVSQESFLNDRIKSGLPLDGDGSGLAEHLEDSRRLARGLLAGAGLGRASFVSGEFQETFGYAPYPLQASVVAELPKLASGPGLLLVMAPPGDGKTEVALHAARVLGEAAGATGIHFALPTMATADQMFDRVVRYARRQLADRAALALVHSNAWLDDRLAALTANLSGRLDPVGVDARVLTGERPDRSATEQVIATSWLRGGKRGVLAPIAVGTIDQVLLAVLPVRHNALRLLGLAGKVLVVDEAHAYDAYMQALLRRVLAWLGELRVPVVLLSATLPTSVAKTLVRAYLTGADPRAPLPEAPVSYPGWAHVDAASRTVTCHCLPSTRAQDLTIGLHPYGDDAARVARLLELLVPVRSGGGCVLVVCNTVGEAQQTREALAGAFAEDPPERRPDLLLLHARFPRWQRAETTSRVERLFGKDGQKRPRAAVLVATQVAEQSLDLDFDLVASDLAPMALLLQRAGRGHRHRRLRPVALRRPRLEVLVPVGPDGACAVPGRWRDIYDADLLLGTQRLLSDRAGRPVRVPDDVQALVDGVYAGFKDETADQRLLKLTMQRIAKDAAQAAIAQLVAIPQRPGAVGDLAKLSRGEIAEELIVTRLGVDSVEALCCFVDPSGHRFIDPACTTPLPERGSGSGGRFTHAETRDLLMHAIPVRRGAWVEACGPEQAVPEAWREEPRLADLVLLPHRVDGQAVTGPVLGATSFLLDPELGLRMTRQPHSGDGSQKGAVCERASRV
jgi:CRISPR-associated endonuclease/helicase Cas3